MNILLVDDDNYMLESVKTMINWEKTGIEEIYSADCVSQAKDIIQKTDIRIILCDIEMNDATGLDFIEWVRKKGGTEQVIFLTGYAEFNYAQKAISLDSMDYLLKPVEFPVLEQRLALAVQKAREQEKTQEYIQRHHTWVQSEAKRKELFFRAVFYGDTAEEDPEINKYKKEYGITYAENQKFIYLRIEVFDYLTIYKKVEGGMFCFILSNITTELFSREGFLPETVFRSDTEDASQWNVVLRVDSNDTEYGMRQVMEDICHNYIGKIWDTMQSKVGCYVGNMASADELKREMERVKKMQADDVTGIGRVRFLSDYKEMKLPYVEPCFSKWEEMLLDYKADAVIHAVNNYLNDLAGQNRLNTKNLEMLLYDFSQMISVVLRSRNISINWLYEKLGYNGYSEVKTIDHMKKYVKDMVTGTMDYLRFVQEEQSVTKIIKNYMKQHLDEELTRETFAELVYLSPDYLAKLFKKEEGISMGQYLNDMRMDRAKSLLGTTDRPINLIAVEVGYANFSYFAKMFKARYSMTPNEYRKQIRHPQ